MEILHTIAFFVVKLIYLSIFDTLRVIKHRFDFLLHHNLNSWNWIENWEKYIDFGQIQTLSLTWHMERPWRIKKNLQGSHRFCFWNWIFKMCWNYANLNFLKNALWDIGRWVRDVFGKHWGYVKKIVWKLIPISSKLLELENLKKKYIMLRLVCIKNLKT
jgi:hypothetical protein